MHLFVVILLLRIKNIKNKRKRGRGSTFKNVQNEKLMSEPTTFKSLAYYSMIFWPEFIIIESLESPLRNASANQRIISVLIFKFWKKFGPALCMIDNNNSYTFDAFHNASTTPSQPKYFKRRFYCSAQIIHYQIIWMKIWTAMLTSLAFWSASRSSISWSSSKTVTVVKWSPSIPTMRVQIPLKKTFLI